MFLRESISIPLFVALLSGCQSVLETGRSQLLLFPEAQIRMMAINRATIIGIIGTEESQFTLHGASSIGVEILKQNALACQLIKIRRKAGRCTIGAGLEGSYGFHQHQYDIWWLLGIERNERYSRFAFDWSVD